MKLPFLERLLVSKTVGSEFGTPLSKFPPNPSQYAVGSVRAVNRYGIDFRLDISDLIQWYLYFGFQDPSHEGLLSRCSKDAVVIDVGANVGITALRMSKAVGAKGHIHAFEPDPRNREQLARNVDLNAAQNITIYPVAVGAGGGKGFIGRSEHNSGMTVIRTVSGNSTEAVEVVSLDATFGDISLNRLDLIKIDVEGGELNVIRGARSLIHRFKPLLYVEVNDKHLRDNGATAAELYATLTDLGYSFAAAAGPSDLRLHSGHLDIICTPSTS